MAIIFYLAILYIENTIKSLKKSAVTILFATGAIFNGYIIAPVINIRPDLWTHYIPIGLFILTIIIRFFPSPNLFHKPIQTHYPIDSIIRYFINLISDIIFNNYFVIISAFIGILLLNISLDLDINSTVSILLFIFTSFVVRRFFSCIIFQYADSVKKRIGILLIFCITLLILFIVIKNLLELKYTLTALMVTIASGFLIEEKLTRPKMRLTMSYNIFDNIYIQLFFSNSKFILHFTILLIVQIGFLVLFSNVLRSNDISNTVQLYYLSYLFISPLILFTYIFNNLFGFFDTYWINCEKIFSKGNSIFVQYLYISLIPILIETSLLVIFIIFNPTRLFDTVMFYFSTLPILLTIGFYSSILLPKKVSSSLLSISSSTSVIANIFSIIVCLSFVITYLNKWFYLLGVIYLFISIFLVFSINDLYRKNRYILLQKLFKIKNDAP